MSVQPYCRACHADDASREGCAEHRDIPGRDYRRSPTMTEPQDVLADILANGRRYDGRIPLLHAEKAEDIVRKLATRGYALVRTPETRRVGGFDVTDGDLDAPDGARTTFERVGGRWEPRAASPTPPEDEHLTPAPSQRKSRNDGQRDA